MEAKILIAWCSLLMLAASPLAGGHLTNPAGSSTSAVVHGDNCRYGGPQPDCTPHLNSGVSGTYVGSSGPFVYGDGFPLSVTPLYTVFPEGSQAISFIVCDLEVLGAGTGPGEPENEEVVDSWPTFGLVPDGTWDDGGQGGACHKDIYSFDAKYCVLRESTELCDSFNTYRCSGSAHAEDAVVGAYVWLSTACDHTTASAGFSTATCTGGILRAGGNGLANCLEAPVFLVSGCGVGDFVECGADGQADAVNYGLGGGSYGTYPYYYADGVPYPSPSYTTHPECTSHAIAVSYVVISVEANVGSLVGDQLPQPIFKDFEGAGAEPNVQYSVPAGGWIDWTGGLGDNDYPVGQGLAIHSGLQGFPECGDGLDNDGDGVTDYPSDGDCSDPLDGTESGGAPNAPACLDQRDNDNDGWLDYPLDPGCSDPFDNSERGTLVCDNGVDDDGDTFADYPDDPGCGDVSDGSELDPTVACDDGSDNDLDGRTDYPDDPGCGSSTDTNERGSTQCDDGRDNDGDRASDYPADPDCTGPADNSEWPPPPPPPPPQPPGGRSVGYG